MNEPIPTLERVVSTPGEDDARTAKPRFDWRYFLTGFVLLSVSFFALTATLDDMGLTDDDRFYVPAGKKYIEWIDRAVKSVAVGDFSVFEDDKLIPSWGFNHEHPPVAKLAMGAGWIVFHKWLGWFGEVDGARMGVIFLAILTLYMVFRFSWEVFGPMAAVMAVLAFMLMPRAFYHMHMSTLDFPTAATSFFVIYAAWRAETKRWWILWAGIAYGIALSTKLNGPFVVFPLLVYWLYRWRQSVVLKQDSTLRFGRMLAIGLAMALLSFPVFFLIWPWIWHETTARLLAYFKFHYNHYGILYLYWGDIYHRTFAPWHGPFVYFLLSTPLMILLTGVYGMWQGLKQLSPRNLMHFTHGPGARQDYALLCAAGVLISISVVAFPDVPKYSGVKLFMPLFPFFAVLVGYGAQTLYARLTALFPKISTHGLAAPAILALMILLPGAIGMIRVYPYMLSYYNTLAGNLPGAAEMGMERQYYDVFFRPTTHYLNEHMKENARVTWEPHLSEYKSTWPSYQRDGKLRQDLKVVNHDKGEFLILTHERHWATYQDLLNKYRHFPALHTERVWGVPLNTIYDIRKPKPRKKAKAKAARKKERKPRLRLQPRKSN